MSLLEIIFLAFALAMDAFAVSIGAAGSGKLRDKRAYFRMYFHFGWFQFMMPVIGWYSGSLFVKFIESADHWIAFLLLLFVGLKMIYEATKMDEINEKENPSKGWNLIMLSVATSIDALIIGFTLAMLNINIWYPSVIIGLLTGTMSFAGILLGLYFKKIIGKKMEIAGGVIIILIGIKILFEHLNLI